MSVSSYNELKAHVGHEIVCVQYGDGVNVSIECETCNEVLLDYDNESSLAEEIRIQLTWDGYKYVYFDHVETNEDDDEEIVCFNYIARDAAENGIEISVENETFSVWTRLQGHMDWTYVYDLELEEEEND